MLPDSAHSHDRTLHDDHARPADHDAASKHLADEAHADLKQTGQAPSHKKELPDSLDFGSEGLFGTHFFSAVAGAVKQAAEQASQDKNKGHGAHPDDDGNPWAKASDYKGGNPDSGVCTSGSTYDYSKDGKQYKGPSFGQPVGTDHNLDVPNSKEKALIDKALTITHMPVNKYDEDAMTTIVTHESTWQPNEPNNWDINAQQCDPSQGLAQTTGDTFKTYEDKKLPGGTNIDDPLANLVASLNYIKANPSYGSLANVPGVRNLYNGGQYQGY